MARKRGSLTRFGKLLKVIFWICLIFFLSVMFTPLPNLLSSYLTVRPDIKKADLIVVLGGGFYPTGELTLSSIDRAVKGIELYFEGKAGKMVFSGGNPKRFPGYISEAGSMAQIAENLRVPSGNIIIEKKSSRTYENAVKVNKIMHDLGLKDAILVTSSYHMLRAKLSFEHAGVIVYPASTAPAEKYITHPLQRLLLFQAVLHEYMGLAYYKWKGWI
ncbi:MAG: YdcF family protein [Thermodesulfobacteriota bacterium]